MRYIRAEITVHSQSTPPDHPVEGGPPYAWVVTWASNLGFANGKNYASPNEAFRDAIRALERAADYNNILTP